MAAQESVVPVEFCATRLQTRELVEYGAGSWGLFVSRSCVCVKGFVILNDVKNMK